ncbi:hypothetical protein GCM10011491_14420 [Brucella endophytica]|uniref:DUF4019 domain-containing protein n=2 Tax=Brucella endophytica TaxID=1963359 RepID=A0A916S9U5_9HYPH|nr:hypothetical protein [Brucella endophytica]GGA87792.1 hypothetical protein GCM10011491_14420 [Brucella endophytica]
MLRALLFAALVLLAPSVATADEDPRRVVEAYYAAIDKGDYQSAYQLWDRQGQASGKSFAAFRDGFLSTARSRVVTGSPTNGDAGMSQQWIDVPVNVHATLTNGRRQHFRGYYRLHRIAPGVGAPADAEKWHISAAKLLPMR